MKMLDSMADWYCRRMAVGTLFRQHSSEAVAKMLLK